MLTALRSQSLHFSTSPASLLHQSWKLGFAGFRNTFLPSIAEFSTSTKGILDLNEVQKVLTDVRADDVKVIPVGERCGWADYMVIATGRSTWHVKNIAQALMYKAKQKQKGAKRMMLPSMQGQEGGKWIVIDSGKVIVHALDEKAREYYNLEKLWGHATSAYESVQDLEKAFVKIRPKNNSKRPTGKSD